MLKSLLLIVPVPSNGAMTNPAIRAPTIPTTIFRKIPCWPSVFMTRLASQPSIPPTMSQIRKFMVSPSVG